MKIQHSNWAGYTPSEIGSKASVTDKSRLVLFPTGYTIVEVLIFLAVSSALLASALLLVSGQQQKQQFTQAVREADSKIQDVINDFSTGIFPNINFSCTADNTGSSPTIVYTGTEAQGTRAGCTFIGKVIQFAPQAISNNEGYNIITVVGRQYKKQPQSSGLIENIIEAKPRVLRGGSVEPGTFGYGLRVEKVTVDVGGAPTNVGAIGFFASFASDAAGFEGGKQTTQLVALGNTSIGTPLTAIVTAVEAIGSGGTIYTNLPVTICFRSGGTDQHGIILIGDNQRQLTTDVTINNGACP
jgi:type II secretory pathway pseudopilin PulG